MKYKIIVIDQTEYWDHGIQKKAGKLFQVCMFNSNEVTNCCESIPSYYLIPLYTYCENYVDEDIMVIILENDILEPFYMHVSAVESYNPKDAGEFDCYEEAEEYLKCNHPI